MQGITMHTSIDVVLEMGYSARDTVYLSPAKGLQPVSGSAMSHFLVLYAYALSSTCSMGDMCMHNRVWPLPSAKQPYLGSQQGTYLAALPPAL